MSRHRNIRNIDLDEELYDEDDYYDEEYDQDEAVQMLVDIVGGSFDTRQLELALTSCEYDVEAAADWLLTS